MRFLIPLVLLSLVACAAPSDEQLAATAQQIAATGVSLTLTAAPTNTTPPTATNTPEPTATQEATQTQQTVATASAPAANGTLASQLPTAPSISEADDRTDKRTPVLLQNNTDEIIWLVVDSPIYFEYRFSDGFLILLDGGDYHYRAWIGSKGPFEGNFHIGNQDKHLLIFSANKVQFTRP